MSKNKNNRFKQSKLLFKASWQALKHDKQLIALPAIGTITTSLLFICAAITIHFNPAKTFYTFNITTGQYDIKLLSYVVLIAFGILANFVHTLISATLIYGALQCFNGKKPTVRNSLTAIKKRFWPLVIFATMNYGIGTILSKLSDRLPFGGKVLTFLADLTWSIASFFTLPVIMNSHQTLNPIKAVKESSILIKKTWGESLIIGVTLSLYITLIVSVYLTIASIISAAMFYFVSTTVGITVSALTFVGLILLLLIFNTLDSFAKAAVFHYAVTGKSPAQFNREMLEAAFTHKQARKVFSL